MSSADGDEVEAPYLFTQLDALLDADWNSYDDYSSGTKAVIDTLNQLAQVVSLSTLIGGTIICILMIPGTHIGADRGNRIASFATGFVAILLIAAIPIGVSWGTKEWAWGFFAASGTVLLGTIIVGFTRSTSQEERSSRWHYVVGILFLATAGGLTGNLTGWNRVGLVSEVAPLLFSAGVGTVAYLLTAQFSRSSRKEQPTSLVVSEHGMKFLASGAASFITAFFFLFHSADRQSSQIARLDACLQMYLEPEFYSGGAQPAPFAGTVFGEVCPEVVSNRFRATTFATEGSP